MQKVKQTKCSTKNIPNYEVLRSCNVFYTIRTASCSIQPTFLIKYFCLFKLFGADHLNKYWLKCKKIIIKVSTVFKMLHNSQNYYGCWQRLMKYFESTVFWTVNLTKAYAMSKRQTTSGTRHVILDEKEFSKILRRISKEKRMKFLFKIDHKTCGYNKISRKKSKVSLLVSILSAQFKTLAIFFSFIFCRWKNS